MIGDTSLGSKYIERTKQKIIPAGEKKSRRINPGDFLLTNSMSFGRPYISKIDGCIHDGWLALSPRRNNISYDYFYHLLSSEIVKAQFVKYASGTTVKNLNSDIVRKVKIPLPPLEEQRRIAGILDKADAIRRKREKALQLTDTLLKSVFLDMFGDPVTNPKGWEVRPLGEFANIDTQMIDPKVEPYIDQVHIGPDSIAKKTGILLKANTAREESLTSGKYAFGPQHLLYSKIRPYLQKVAMPTFEGICSADVYPILPRENLSTKEFIWSVLISDSFVKYFNSLPDRANIPKINMKEMNAYACILPPFELQETYKAKVRSVLNYRQDLTDTLHTGEQLLACLTQRAFRGELTSSDLSTLEAAQ